MTLNKLVRTASLMGKIAIVAFLASSCAGGSFTQDPTEVFEGQTSSAYQVTSGGVTTTTEPFENGSKTSYAAATVALETGSWTLDDALIGTSASDRKSGTKAVRLQQTGKATMLFNLTNGAATVTVKHAVYGSDGTSMWELWKSVNSGSSWSKVGSTVTTSSTTLATASFTVNQTGTVRFEVRKISGGTNRLNIDDVAVTDSGSSGGGTLTEHITLGNPSGAITDTGAYSNYLMVKSQYALSYSRDEGKANWVAWHLDSTWLGSATRQDDFRADTTLPSGWYQVGGSSYSGSGFDRGHYCPSADRTKSVAINSSTFLMTNMMPQAPDNNQGPWARLEDYERSLVDEGYELYIYAGSYGSGGTGSNGSATTVDSGRVKVPNRVWKVIVVLPTGSNDASRVTTTTRVIAVNMPNTQGIRSVNWGTYRVTVNSIESATGFDLLSEVPSSIQSVIEAVVDNGPTS